MDGIEIKLDMEQRRRAVDIEPQVTDDPEWACSAIIWQRDALASRDAEIERLSDQLKTTEAVLLDERYRSSFAAEEITRLRALVEKRGRQLFVVVNEGAARVMTSAEHSHVLEWDPLGGDTKDVPYDGTPAGLLAAIDEVAK